MNLDKRVRRLAVASIGSGVLLSLAFASDAMGWVAWVALVPMIVVLRDTSLTAAGLAGLAGGGIAALGTFGWLLVVPAVGPVQAMALALYLSLYLVCWCMGVVWLQRRRMPLLIGAPALWVALDFLRAHADFLALPWATLAQSQHTDLALLQLAALGGEAAVSFAVVMGNVAIASLVGQPLMAWHPWRSAALAGSAIALAHGAGALMLLSDEPGPVLQVAAIQPSIGINERDSAAGRDAIWQRLERLTWQAARLAPPTPQQRMLVVWPETAVGDPRHDPQLAAKLAALANATQAALIVGAAETEKFVATEVVGQTLREVVRERERYNSAYLVAPGAPLGEPYRKRRLVPFGETTPLKDRLSWPAWLVPAIGEGQAGDDFTGFELAGTTSHGWRDAAHDVSPDVSHKAARVIAHNAAHEGPRQLAPVSVRIGVLICWENLFADLSREAVRDQAQVLVQLTNDVWFGKTRASAQHNAVSVLRAVENRVPIVIASNTGASQIVDAQGRIQTRVPGLFSQGVAVASVAIGGAGTLYTRTGDVFSWACIACAAAALFTPRRLAWPARRIQPTTLFKEST